MRMSISRLMIVISMCSAVMVQAAPPTFIPPKVMELPKTAAMVDLEVQKSLTSERKSLVVFDVHGIFTKETRPTADGNVTLSNRFVPTLKTAMGKGARLRAISAHEKPEVLHEEMQSLRYGHDKGETVFSDFTREGPAKREDALLLLPFRDGTYRIVVYTRLGDIVSAGLPNLRYKTEKVPALLLSLFGEEAIKALTISRDTYDKVMSQAHQIVEKVAQLIAVRAGRFYPVECSSWSTLESVTQALIELSNLGISGDVFANRLNDLIEKRVCGIIKGNKRVYPNGKPTNEHKEALKAGTKELIEALLQETRKLPESLKAADIEQARRELSHSTAGVQLIYIDDDFDNVVHFQTEILNSGYFEDATVLLEYALPAPKDKELSPMDLEARIGQHSEKKRSKEGIKNSQDRVK